ncbi:MAG TPA: alpha/beta fold hydrolase [Dokdonella sp.]|nr:alpha/beta fold hydrolase [Dokdonella sp.]
MATTEGVLVGAAADAPRAGADLPRGADFAPPRWLANPHLQSILASSALRRLALRRAQRELDRHSEAHVLDCGAGVRLQGFLARQHARERAHGLVVLLHGWEGSARSSYVVGTGARLLADGFDVFRLNFRDHGDTHHLNRELFHSCRIDEVVAAVRLVRDAFAAAPVAVAGFSLGGNFALRVALRAAGAVRYALAVCPVVSPAAGLFGLEEGFWIYERYFLHKWRESLRRKRALFPEVDWFSADDLASDLRGLTRALVLRHTDFGSLEAYLDGYSIAGDRLRALAVPATILTAADDPVIPVADFRALQLPPQVELDIAEHGGHCGFLLDASLRSFTSDYIARRMQRHLAHDPPAA